MKSKNTNLTDKHTKDIDDIVASFGRIVSTDDIYKALGTKYSKLFLKKRVFELKDKGCLVPLRRGLYFIFDIASTGSLSTSPLVIASAFDKDSYISLDAALNHYGLFEQKLHTLSSVATFKSRKYVFQENTYQYLKIKRKLYFGFKTENIEGYNVKIADFEKMVLDYLYFKNDSYSIDLLLEKLQKSKDRIDFKKLFTYAAEFPEATKRKLGFILDMLNIDTGELHKMVGAKGYSKLTPASKKFNAKWRLYYEDRLTAFAKIWTAF